MLPEGDGDQARLRGAHNNLGDVLVRRGQVDAAIAEYRKALEIKPDYAAACNNLGGVLAELGQVNATIVLCQRAVEIDPDFVPALKNLAWIRAAHSDPKFRDGHRRLRWPAAPRPWRRTTSMPWTRWPRPTPRRAICRGRRNRDQGGEPRRATEQAGAGRVPAGEDSALSGREALSRAAPQPRCGSRPPARRRYRSCDRPPGILPCQRGRRLACRRLTSVDDRL